jgi:hypothetical protein
MVKGNVECPECARIDSAIGCKTVSTLKALYGIHQRALVNSFVRWESNAVREIAH